MSVRKKKNIKERETRVKMLVAQSCLTVTPWTVAHQPSLSMELSKQEYWSGLPFPSPGDPPDPEIEPGSPALRADSLPSKLPGKPHKRAYNKNKNRGVFCTQKQVHSNMRI